ncbi:flagellar basal body rod protein FlgB [Shewanella dokdonensis]|uniref:Flagellar basal body rod protein FlgB n=1 Tax=Shewanella dokdonensis TaxID=712036 RepID=A0ABX8DM96_9GAMM|nr:flagellar basal body rod protein FlgB [Shewanella dokdonensis]QVK24907.1 flagellar basal body rod protein FlgB [Shewanella dokdonensis]
MQLRLERAEIIAGNLANVDTPGFKARDIDYNSVMQDVQQQVQLTSGSHVDMTTEHPLMYRIPYQPSADGNSVELNVEQANFAKNTMDFQTSMTFLNMKINGLYSAIKGK